MGNYNHASLTGCSCTDCLALLNKPEISQFRSTPIEEVKMRGDETFLFNHRTTSAIRQSSTILCYAIHMRWVSLCRCGIPSGPAGTCLSFYTEHESHGQNLFGCYKLRGTHLTYQPRLYRSAILPASVVPVCATLAVCSISHCCYCPDFFLDTDDGRKFVFDVVIVYSPIAQTTTITTPAVVGAGAGLRADSKRRQYMIISVRTSADYSLFPWKSMASLTWRQTYPCASSAPSPTLLLATMVPLLTACMILIVPYGERGNANIIRTANHSLTVTGSQPGPRLAADP